MKKIWILFGVWAGAVLLGGCSYSDQQDAAAEGADIIIETQTDTGAETDPGPSSPWLPPEETTIAPLKLPELPTETDTVNPEIVIASDIHYLAKELTDFGNAFSEMARNEDGKMVSYVWEITDAFLGEVIARRPQVLILSGDLTLNGEYVSHEALALQLKRVEEAGIPVVVIPGNHDINNSKASVYKGSSVVPGETTSPEQFARIYEDFGYSEAMSRDPYSLSYIYELRDGTWLLMLDSCQYEGSALVGGMIRTGTYEWIDTELEKAWNDDRRVIAVSHHNLLDESRIYEDDCTIEHSEDLQEKLSRWGVGLFLSGHLHVQHYKESEEYFIDEIVTSALSIFPCQYGVLQFFGPDHYYYQTRKTNITAWAEERNNPDRNLHNFDEYANEFLKDVFYREAMKELEGKELRPEQIRNMADLYGTANVHAVAGSAYKIQDFIIDSEAYKQWQEYDHSSILCMYLNEIVEDAVVDYNEKRKP